MSKRENERCRDACKWMQANYGRACLAPLTGTDWRAFKALVHAWELWTYTRTPAAFDACVMLLRCMQRSTRDLGVALVPFAADWSDEERVREMIRVMPTPGCEDKKLLSFGLDGVSPDVLPQVEGGGRLSDG